MAKAEIQFGELGGGGSNLSFSGKVIQKINTGAATATLNAEKGKTYAVIRAVNASDYNSATIGGYYDYTNPAPPTIKNYLCVVFRIENDNTIKQSSYISNLIYITMSGTTVTYNTNQAVQILLLELETE